MKKVLLFLLIILACNAANAQSSPWTFGIQYKPIVPTSLFRTATNLQQFESLEFDHQQRFGYVAGMVLRRAFTDKLALETGINYAQRNYRMNLRDFDTEFAAEDDFGIVGYEVPIQGLLYIRLNKQVYMNTAFGVSIDMYPSAVGGTTSRDSTGRFLYHVSSRTNWMMGSLVANVGFEFRTKDNGFFYLGGSFHRTFGSAYTTYVNYQRNTEILASFEQVIDGNYLTIDFRYFFSDTKTKKKKKK